MSGTPFEHGTSRGNLAWQSQLGVTMRADLPRGSTQYDINVDLTNFSADKMLFGQKVEATALQIAANNQGYQIRGEVRVNATQAQIDYRKLRSERDAELRLQATLDDAARARFGFTIGAALSGPLPVRLRGRVNEADDRIPVSTWRPTLRQRPSTDCCQAGTSRPANRRARCSRWSRTRSRSASTIS